MRILIKIGSALTNRNNKFNYGLIKEKVKEISQLHKENNEILIVSSGAVACGMEIEKLNERPREALKLQLLSGEGQAILMKRYGELFENENIRIAQVLLTHHNFDTKDEKEVIINILNAYLKQKIIPLINENDLVNKEELEDNKLFPDNDILAALVAKEIKADLVIILTDVNGLYKSNPKINSNSELIEEVKNIDNNIKKMAQKETNSLGLGGMYSKVIAAEMLTKSGINMIIANGNLKIKDILENKVKRTLFIVTNP